MPAPIQLPDALLRRVPRQTRSRERLARVLEVADRLLGTEGVEALTMIRVAAAARISVGSLYQYLPDRDAIIEALAGSYLAMIESRTAALLELARAERWPDPTDVLIDAFAHVYRGEPGFRALWFGRHLTEAARAADREHKRRMAVTLREIMIAQGIAAPGPDLDIACRTAHLMGDAVMQEAFRTDPEGDPGLLREAKIALRAYAAQWAAP
ncbi:TetR family transcriptional regulator [Nocardia sp. NBC_01503]|uniref:TetR/AcrR family transcriptional regulator n=1 Tax=Nocardia sp. NBC_01503 TaxID=2975997 RepID=UPI002E7C1E62|nr:TetR family transcriptional regulator [Nocardia sp. NBC_01503]WTL30809.1 TetR family transcriptional regulator [Nocardia sp. NBC_01503]